MGRVLDAGRTLGKELGAPTEWAQCSHMVTEGVATGHNVNNVSLVHEIKVHSLSECCLQVRLFSLCSACVP